MMALKYLSEISRVLEIQLINGEINLILTWFVSCYIVASTIVNQVPTFAKTDQNFMFQL